MREFLHGPCHFCRISTRSTAGNRLDAAHTGRNARFTDNLEQANLSRVGHMRAAAELDAEVRDTNDTDNIAVLLSEESHRAKCLCLINRHRGDMEVNRTKYLFIDKLFDIAKLLLAHRFKVCEIKAKSFRCNK